MAHVGQAEVEGNGGGSGNAPCPIQSTQSTQLEEASTDAPSSRAARQMRKIAQLEGKLEILESGHAVKDRKMNHYVAQGRAIRRVVSLFDNVEDLMGENDRRYEEEGDITIDQDRLQTGYITLLHTLKWFEKKTSEMDYDEYSQMLKMLRQGADGPRGDDTSKLKALVAEWVNGEFKPDPRLDPDDKHCRRFANDACGRLLCPTELDWNSATIKAGIRNRTEGHIVTNLSFPTFLYEKYTANVDNLEEGLFKGKILVQVYKAVFTSPSSARDIEGDGDGADIIQNNRRARRSSSGLKVKKHVTHIIKMRKVTPRSIAYIACQVRFALSAVTSWRSVDGNFDYVQFWTTIVDFFERPPGRAAQRRVDRLLEWWTRKVFGHRGCEDISEASKANMSVNALARQRMQLDDASFDSD
ncbi:hypothetical protein DFH29DRAFT_998401 [Suillus ampliporus]|nr:hypothetical protein DFH29DRAFT_998401 [Suillus ampliporus]